MTQWIEHVNEGRLYMPYYHGHRAVFLVGGLNIGLFEDLARFDGRVAELSVGVAGAGASLYGPGVLTVETDDYNNRPIDVSVDGISLLSVLKNLNYNGSSQWHATRVVLTVAPDDEERHTVGEWLSRNIMVNGTRLSDISPLTAKMIEMAPDGLDGYLTRQELADLMARAASALGMDTVAKSKTYNAKPVPDWMLALFRLMERWEDYDDGYEGSGARVFHPLDTDQSDALDTRADAMAIELGYRDWEHALRESRK